MQSLNLDFSGMDPYVSKDELEIMSEKVFEAHDALQNKTGLGRNMLRMARSTRKNYRR